jgi:hypothetical protein
MIVQGSRSSTPAILLPPLSSADQDPYCVLLKSLLLISIPVPECRNGGHSARVCARTLVQHDDSPHWLYYTD